VQRQINSFKTAYLKIQIITRWHDWRSYRATLC